MLACRSGQEPVITALAALGASEAGEINRPDGEGMTGLMHAAAEGRLGAVQQLLAAKAGVEAKRDADGATALLLAVMGRHAEVVRALLRVGAKLNARLEPCGRSAHVIAEERGFRDVAAVLDPHLSV